MHDHDLITSKEFASQVGMSSSYICRLARDAKKKGHPWPIKRSDKKTQPWEAPKDEWVKILNLFGKGKGKVVETESSPENNYFQEKELYSVSDAVAEIKRRLGRDISVRWLAKLGSRNQQLGGRWPEKVGRAKVAPISEWISIMNDKRLRAWTRK